MKENILFYYHSKILDNIIRNRSIWVLIKITYALLLIYVVIVVVDVCNVVTSIAVDDDVIVEFSIDFVIDVETFVDDFCVLQEFNLILSRVLTIIVDFSTKTHANFSSLLKVVQHDKLTADRFLICLNCTELEIFFT